MEKPVKKMTLGKKILIGVGIFAIMGIIGSQMGDEGTTQAAVAGSSDSKAAGNSSKNEEKKDYKQIGDQIEVGNFTYVVKNAKFVKSIGDEVFKKTADGIYLVVELNFRNNDSEEHTLDNSFFKLTDESGTEFSSSDDGTSALEMSGRESLFLKSCNPKISKSGFLVFEVPEKKAYDIQLSGGFWSGKTAAVRVEGI